MNGAIATFIVDDEPLARKRLQRLLRSDPAIRIVGSFASAAEAANAARHVAPQLLLLDIRMPEADGFNFIATLAERGLAPYTIFVTAHADRSLDAFAIGAVDYLLKPFDADRLKRAVSRAKALLGTRDSAVDSGQQPQAANDPTRLMLAERGRIIVLSINDIEFAQVVSRHVKIFSGGHCYTFNSTLEELEQRIDSARFVRIHRSTLINIQHLSQLLPAAHGDYEVVLRRGTRLMLSRRYRARLDPFLLGRCKGAPLT